MREWDSDCVAMAVSAPDGLRDAPHAQQPPGGQAADRDNQRGLDELELPVPPEGTKLLLTEAQ